jgi:hypothetical protein
LAIAAVFSASSPSMAFAVAASWPEPCAAPAFFTAATKISPASFAPVFKLVLAV